MGREPREVWAKRIERWRDSGLSAREFADEVGVNPDRLRYWKWQLAKVSAATADAPVVRAAKIVAVPFVEVAPPAIASEADAEAIEIVTPSGLRVRVPARFDEEALRRVLRAVR
jgi:hypothetical protein